jgi:hypothetical protein
MSDELAWAMVRNVDFHSPGESMTRALAWGVGRARRLASDERPVLKQVA